jgi:hypothetical protein
MADDNRIAGSIISVLKLTGGPGSLVLFAACLLIALIAIYIWPRNRAFGRGWLLSVVAVHVTLSLPCVARAIADRLPRVAAPGAMQHVDTLIVLDGDNWQGRLRQAERVLSIASPRVVWLLGNATRLDSLQEIGIPRARINLASGDQTTRDQMTHVRELLVAGQSDPTAIVASRLQMPRVAALVRTLGLHVTLLSSPVDAEPPTSGTWLFIPAFSALRLSQDALYEHAALAYYRWRKWTA